MGTCNCAPASTPDRLEINRENLPEPGAGHAPTGNQKNKHRHSGGIFSLQMSQGSDKINIHALGMFISSQPDIVKTALWKKTKKASSKKDLLKSHTELPKSTVADFLYAYLVLYYRNFNMDENSPGPMQFKTITDPISTWILDNRLAQDMCFTYDAYLEHFGQWVQDFATDMSSFEMQFISSTALIRVSESLDPIIDESSTDKYSPPRAVRRPSHQVFNGSGSPETIPEEPAFAYGGGYEPAPPTTPPPTQSLVQGFSDQSPFDFRVLSSPYILGTAGEGDGLEGSMDGRSSSPSTPGSADASVISWGQFSSFVQSKTTGRMLETIWGKVDKHNRGFLNKRRYTRVMTYLGLLYYQWCVKNDPGLPPITQEITDRIKGEMDDVVYHMFMNQSIHRDGMPPEEREIRKQEYVSHAGVWLKQFCEDKGYATIGVQM